MKPLFSLVCLVVVGVCPLLAQEGASSGPPPTTQEVLEFFKVMHVREQTSEMLKAEQKQIKVMLDDMFIKNLPKATPEERAQFEKLTDGAISDLFANYPVDDILREEVPIYQKHLTESDLNAVVAFYLTPVGQKLRREMPVMTSEAMRISYVHIQPRIEEMMKNMEARLQKMADHQTKGESASKK